MTLAARQGLNETRTRCAACALLRPRAQAKSRRRTLEVAVALAVGGAPEPRRAVLAAREQPLPVGAQAQPVDAALVIRADLHGRAAVPHRGADHGRARCSGPPAVPHRPASAITSTAKHQRGSPGSAQRHKGGTGEKSALNHFIPPWLHRFPSQGEPKPLSARFPAGSQAPRR